MESTPITASVIICTRDRGDSVATTVASVLRNAGPGFEVILVDQSSTTATRTAVAPFLTDPRFCYLATNTIGAGRARNLAIANSSGEFLLVTDDDCTVPENWIETIVSIFQQQPGVGVIFSNVAAGPHDPSRGLIPHHLHKRSRAIHSVTGYANSVGMGAGMSIRRAVIGHAGLLDDRLGPGTELGSAEDHDYALRVLLHGWQIYEATETSVVHYGFRSNEEALALVKRDWLGLGVVHAKLLKCGQWRVLPLIAYFLAVRLCLQPMLAAFKGQRPRGLKRLGFYLQGFLMGWRPAVDRRRLVYQPIHSTRPRGSNLYQPSSMRENGR